MRAPRPREVPEWEDLRTLASQIKEHTLSHLADYLEQFGQRAVANGARVHWARDAHEHNQTVYDILSSHGAKTLVKSKSMLTEECELRPFLERRGITVTETDLGERIQQLDHQPPSHIVGPAFQKTTKDIAEEFGRVYGSDPDRADQVYLAQVMREHTRPLILASDAGMTGANFAVAQTGAVVTVTNEGNADLSGNVPGLRICSVAFVEDVIPAGDVDVGDVIVLPDADDPVLVTVVRAARMQQPGSTDRLARSIGHLVTTQRLLAGRAGAKKSMSSWVTRSASSWCTQCEAPGRRSTRSRAGTSSGSGSASSGPR